jgi:tRNA isopentenyl-2-thiomethyl-A-37 hydroxylase MiaE
VLRRKFLIRFMLNREIDTLTCNFSCFLLTFYFTQVILPKLIECADRDSCGSQISDAVAFVERYGSYLKLPMCLAYAAFLRSEEVISKLLSLAKHDLRHQEALLETAKANTLVLYEPVRIA